MIHFEDPIQDHGAKIGIMRPTSLGLLLAMTSLAAGCGGIAILDDPAAGGADGVASSTTQASGQTTSSKAASSNLAASTAVVSASAATSSVVSSAGVTTGMTTDLFATIEDVRLEADCSLADPLSASFVIHYENRGTTSLEYQIALVELGAYEYWLYFEVEPATTGFLAPGEVKDVPYTKLPDPNPDPAVCDAVGYLGALFVILENGQVAVRPQVFIAPVQR